MSRYKEKYKKNCTHICPACKRICVLMDEHKGAHRCELHEWIAMFYERLNVCLFTNGMVKP